MIYLEIPQLSKVNYVCCRWGFCIAVSTAVIAEEACNSATEEACFFQWNFNLRRNQKDCLSLIKPALTQSYSLVWFMRMEFVSYLMRRFLKTVNLLSGATKTATTYNSTTQPQRHLKCQQKVDVIAPKRKQENQIAKHLLSKNTVFFVGKVVTRSQIPNTLIDGSLPICFEQLEAIKNPLSRHCLKYAVRGMMIGLLLYKTDWQVA